MNKSLITNILALSLTIYGMFSPIYSTEIFMAGLFSLSGGLTNWLAIHMLFEKVPLLYGSGVIPDRFEEFKQGIRELILTEFFSLSSINNFLENKVSLKKNDLSKELDYNLIFTKLTEAIEESSLGSMLGMVGGKKALEPLKEPFKKKIKEVVEDVSNKMVEENDKTAESVRKDLEEIIFLCKSFVVSIPSITNSFNDLFILDIASFLFAA